jgi:hypothetical protein
VVQDGTKFQRRRVRRLRDGGTMPATRGHTLYLVGGAPRVGKSSLAQRLLNTDGIPWLPTDVLRTVLRRVLPGLDAVDQDPVDARLLAEVTYPHVEQAAEVCAEEAERFLIEGFELSPSYPRACRRRWRGPRSGPASWGTARSPSATSSPTGAPSPSTTARRARSSTRPRPGSGGGAGNCAKSAPTPACRTSTWARSASSCRLADEHVRHIFADGARHALEHRRRGGPPGRRAGSGLMGHEHDHAGPASSEPSSRLGGWCDEIDSVGRSTSMRRSRGVTE